MYSHVQSYLLFRVRSHERRNELRPVWDFKPAWKQVLFTWHFISAAFQNNPIFWWTYVSISFRVVFTWLFYHPKWNFISVKMTDMKFITTMSSKHTCALDAISYESALIRLVSGKFCSHENLMPVWNFISVKMTYMKSPRFMWTQIKSWSNTEVRFSTKIKSNTDLSSFRLFSYWKCDHLFFGVVFCSY